MASSHAPTTKTPHFLPSRCKTLQDTARQCKTPQHTATNRKIPADGASEWPHHMHCEQNIPLLAITLQHAATHRNTLQHTATRCNTLQHTATHLPITSSHAMSTKTSHFLPSHCNTLQHAATHHNTRQHTARHLPMERVNGLVTSTVNKNIPLHAIWHHRLRIYENRWNVRQH